jgi:hypothetical protein
MWLAKPDNAQYFCGPVHVQRVRAWRAAHPGYGLNRSRVRPALQDALLPQVPESIEEIPVRSAPLQSPAGLALQDLLNPSTAVLAGLIAHLFEVSLQDDIANTTRRLVQRGQDLIRSGGGGDEGQQTFVAARAAAPSARAVQLG